VILQATKDGPLVVKGSVTLELPTGKVEERKSAFLLCRCGQTQTTPFCDGSHERVGFKSPR
jgi:CDGSH-type Zn-finger protein